MTRTNLLTKIQFFTMAIIANLAVVLVKAQEKGADLNVDLNVDKGSGMGGDWMSNPLVWVIGALVVIVLVALVARGNGNK